MTTRLIAKTACGKGGNNLTRLYNCRDSDEYQVFADGGVFAEQEKGRKNQNENQGTEREKKSPTKQPIIPCLLCQ